MVSWPMFAINRLFTARTVRSIRFTEPPVVPPKERQRGSFPKRVSLRVAHVSNCREGGVPTEYRSESLFVVPA